MYVALEEGVLAGVAAFEMHGRQASLEHLWVDPARIRSGVGSALLSHVCAVALERGARVLRIESDPHAEGFYLRRGARRIGAVRADMDESQRSLPLLEIKL